MRSTEISSEGESNHVTEVDRSIFFSVSFPNSSSFYIIEESSKRFPLQQMTADTKIIFVHAWSYFLSISFISVSKERDIA